MRRSSVIRKRLPPLREVRDFVPGRPEVAIRPCHEDECDGEERPGRTEKVGGGRQRRFYGVERLQRALFTTGLVGCILLFQGMPAHDPVHGGSGNARRS